MEIVGAIERLKREQAPKTLEVAGIQVEFPFEPYDCQRAYMSKVIGALQAGQNALLESPTGTGKTLCLLCSTLAWRESLKMQRMGLAGGGADPSQQPAASTSSAGGGFGRGPRTSASGGPHDGGGGSSSGMPGPQYGAGGRAPRTSGSGGPHASSAAGGGGGGAGGGAAGSVDVGGLPVIIYASRTHSQLAQVIKELRNSSYRDRVKATILASRQQMCLNPRVTSQPGGATNTACKSLTSHKACRWHNNLKFSKQHPVTDTVPDIEELVRVGRAHEMCPFYMSRDLSKDADIIFMPYNYLLDFSSRSALEGVRWHNAVVVFDEAHNVEGVCTDVASFDLDPKLFDECCRELTRAIARCNKMAASGEIDGEGKPGQEPINYGRAREDFETLLRLVQGLMTEIAKVQVPQQEGRTYPGDFLLQMLERWDIKQETFGFVQGIIDTVVRVLLDDEADIGRTMMARAATAGLTSLRDHLGLAFSTTQLLRDGKTPAHKFYRTHVHWERSGGRGAEAGKIVKHPTLSFWCFLPGMAMKALASYNVRSVLLTSGTLSPLDSFAAELQLPFPVRLENPHIIQPHQVWVGVVPFGPSGVPLNSGYQSRDDPKYKEDLGNAIVNYARLVPDGLLVFFPSYVVMEKALDYWKSSSPGGGATIWERIVRLKAPVVEPKESSHFQAAINDYREKLDLPGGAVFFAVCRGKVSEGLDFADRAGRAVVVTGIPYAMKMDPRVTIKRQVLDEENRKGPAGFSGGLTGEQWYTQQAMRAVNQALGRVIRHRFDWGAVILADGRFAQPGTQRQLSKWLQEHVQVAPNFGVASQSLTKFFKEKAGWVPPNSSSNAAAQSGSRAAGGGGGGGGLMVEAAAAKPGAGASAAAGGASSSQGGGGGGGGAAALMDRLGVPAASDVWGGAMPNIGGSQAGGVKSGAAAAALSRGASSSLRQAASTSAGAAGGGGGAGDDSLMSKLLSAVDQGKKVPTAQLQAQAGSVAGGGGGASGSLLPGGWALGGGGGSQAQRPRQQRGHLTISYQGSGNPMDNVVGPARLVQEHQKQVQATAAGMAPPANPLMRSASAGSASASTSAAVGVRPLTAPPVGTAPAAARAALPPSATAKPLVSKPSAEASSNPAAAAAASAATKPSAATAQTAEAAAAAATGDKAAAAPAPQPQPQAKPARVDPKAYMEKLKRELPRPTYDAIQELLRSYRQSKDVRAFIDGVVDLLKGPDTVHVLQGFVDFIPKRDQAWFGEVVAVHVSRAGSGGSQAISGSGGEGGAAAKGQQSGPLRAVLPPQKPTGIAASAAAGAKPAAVARAVLPPKQQGAAAAAAATAAAVKRPAEQPQPAPEPSGAAAAVASAGVDAAPYSAVKKAKLAMATAQCAICGRNPMQTPHRAPCDHLACFGCWTTHLGVAAKCPTCSAPLPRGIKSLQISYFS